MKKIEIKTQYTESSIILEFNPNVYALDVIKQASYKLTDKCAFTFALTDEPKIIVTLIFLYNTDTETQTEIINLFHNEILDQDLRKTIASETEQIRNLILANAFSNSQLINPE